MYKLMYIFDAEDTLTANTGIVECSVKSI